MALKILSQGGLIIFENTETGVRLAVRCNTSGVSVAGEFAGYLGSKI